MSNLLAVFRQEYLSIIKNKVVLIFFVAPLLYPLLYNVIYYHEVVRDIPVAVVDLSETARSRDYIRRLDAAPELRVERHCVSLEEARDLFYAHEVQGIFLIPSDFSNTAKQAKVSAYFNMGSFFYYKGMMTAVSMVSKDFDVEHTQAPLKYRGTALFNSGNGFASFLLPAVLILILYQTLVLGIAILAGAGNETGAMVAGIRRYGLLPSVVGKAFCYFSLYAAWTAYILFFIPAVFNLPQIGHSFHLVLVLLPFLLSAIFFAMTITSFIRTAERAFIYLLFLTLPLLFLSGVSWPMSNMPAFWRAAGYLLPTTQAIQAFVRINSMQAGLNEVLHEFFALWGLAAVYFCTAIWAYRKKSGV